MTRPLAAIVLALCASLCSCASDEPARRAVSAYMIGDFEQAREILRPLAKKTDEHFVLNNLRLGSASLVDYRLDEAEAAFLAAYEVINSVGVNNGGRSLGAVMVSENLKVWKGEPFERAMANFYLGLIYYLRGEYPNARGAFENALFKLREYDEAKGQTQGEVPSTFALGHLMLARTWQRLGREDMARTHFQAVSKLRPDLAELADYDYNAAANLLLVVDFGFGPQKVREFDGSIVGFGPAPHEAGPVPLPMVMLDGRPAPTDRLARPPLDLLAMAQDRKWQSIDTIRFIKSTVGTGLIAAGAYQGLRHDSHGAEAAALIAAGLLLKATSQGDIRQWEMLPRTTFVIPLQVQPGQHTLTIDFPGLPGLQQTWRNLPVPDKGEAAYYFRIQRWTGTPRDWPPPALQTEQQPHATALP